MTSLQESTKTASAAANKAAEPVRLPVKSQINPLLASVRQAAQRLGFGKKAQKPQADLLEAQLLLKESTPESAEKALQLYTDAISVNPNAVAPWMGLARCYSRLGAYADAVIALEQVLEINQFSGEAHLELGKAQNHLGQYESARMHFERATRLMPTSIDARFGLALLEELANDAEISALHRAVGLYQQVLKLDKAYLPAYNNLGSLYLRLGELGKAQALFRRMTDLAPTFSRGYWGLGMVFDRNGEPEKSLRYYRKTLELSPNNPYRQAIIDRIADIEQGMAHAYSQLGQQTPQGTAASTPALVRVK
ncbi:MAG: tetratricopeptide repeat protein [Vampirovibrionales bacterium]|nr:tetratricopeptide repeat protein [Vampirovibrionales bacterium]